MLAAILTAVPATPMLLSPGRGVVPDIRRAAELYASACERNDMRGCSGLGELHITGEGGLSRDVPRAIELFAKACGGKDSSGCRDLDRWIIDGDFVNRFGTATVSLPRVLGLLRNACTADVATACNALARHYVLGVGVRARATEARALLARSCDLGNVLACRVLAPEVQHRASGARTHEAWNAMVAATRNFSGMRVTPDEMLGRLSLALESYAAIQTTGVDAELISYVHSWREHANDLLQAVRRGQSTTREKALISRGWQLVAGGDVLQLRLELRYARMFRIPPR